MAGWSVRFSGTVARVSDRLMGLATYAVIGLILFLTFNVMLRYLFASPLAFTEEVTGYFLAFLVFFGLGYTLRVGGHVITDVLVQNFSAETRKKMQTPIVVGGLIFSVFMVLSAWMLLIKNYVRGSVEFGSLRTPEWIPNLIFVVGSMVFFLEMVALLFRARGKE